MAGAQISTSVSIIDNLKGYMALSLTEYSTSTAAAIAAGSVVEIAGAFFTFASDETPTGWSSVVTATTGYIALTASGTAGSQVVNANYTSTAPTWRDDLQGWYASAASSVRIVASVYKAESTSYYPKYVLAKDQELSFNSGVQIRGIASVASSLSVGGVASVASTMSISGKLYPTGIVPINYLHGDNITYGSVFSLLSTYLPATGNTIIISGALGNGTDLYSITRAVRASSTVIDLYVVRFNTTGTVSCASGSGTTFDLSIAF